MTRRSLLLIVVCVTSATALADTSSVQIDGEVYGAVPDDVGPRTFIATAFPVTQNRGKLFVEARGPRFQTMPTGMRARK